MSTFLDNPPSALLRRFASLLEPVSDAQLEAMAQQSQAITRRHFGRTIRLFAPLYLSNECINNCTYCGFSRDNAILRVTLDIQAMLQEARHLTAEGFRSILLVAGEHPKFVSNGYLEDCVRALAAEVPSVALEVAPMEAPEYARLVQAGAEGLIVYQETYDRDVYAEGLRRGGFLVSASVDQSNYDTAHDILDDAGSIDLDERADLWRIEGWTAGTGSQQAAASKEDVFQADAAAGSASGPGRYTRSTQATSPRVRGYDLTELSHDVVDDVIPTGHQRDVSERDRPAGDRPSQDQPIDDVRQSQMLPGSR